MEVVDDTKGAARLRPLAIAILSKQDNMLSGDSSLSTTHSPLQSGLPLCPAYRFCRESRGPYRPPMVDRDDQQITILHDLLQAIKEAALKLIQLISSDEERRRRNADPRMRYPDSRYERSKHFSPHSPGSGLMATTSSSVCALCGVALHLKDSKELKQFVVDKERNDGLLKQPDDIKFLKMAYKGPLPAEKNKNTDKFLISRNVFDYILPKEIHNIDKRAKEQEKISSKTQSTDTNGLKSKLLFIRQTPSQGTTYQMHQDESQQRYDSARQMPSYVSSKHDYKTSDSLNQCIVNISSTISSMQDASTFTQEVLCPCACGLLVTDETKSEISINPMPTLKDKHIKTELEKLGFHSDSRKMAHTKVHDDTVKVKKKTKTQKLEKDINVKRWIEEIVQLRLQMQIEELHKNIQFFKQENEYIRRFAEKCRCLSEDIGNLQQLLPIRSTYSGFTTTIKHLQTKYHNEHGIIATLTGIFRGSINIQQIATRLLAPFLEHWNSENKYFKCDANKYNRIIMESASYKVKVKSTLLYFFSIITTRISSAPRAQAPLKSPSSIVFNVY